MPSPLLLVQFLDPGDRRQAGRVSDDGQSILALDAADGVRGLAQAALEQGCSLAEVVEHSAQDSIYHYADLVARGRLLSPVDHPDAAHCLLSGTGLTHRASAAGRDAMHAAAQVGRETDSMRMYRWGESGGQPPGSEVGVQPEWFYKGDASMLVAPGGDLPLPSFAEDGGEEAELAGVYLIAADGTPVRLGFTLANEFSDHKLEARNYLYLAHSKLRCAAIGPELLVGELPPTLEGRVRLLRAGDCAWETTFQTGEAQMCHSIGNLEHHHFKYPLFRRAGDLHVHFMGAAALSAAAGVETRDDDCFEISATPFVQPLVNRMRRVDAPGPVRVKVL
jgi:hypothetical protein